MLLDTSMKKIDDKLIVSLESDLSDSDLKIMVEEVIEKVAQTKASGVILDFSMVEVITGYSYGVFRGLTQTINLMGTKTVWVSLRPGVVVSLIDLNLIDKISDIETGMTVEQGISMLQSRD